MLGTLFMFFDASTYLGPGVIVVPLSRVHCGHEFVCKYCLKGLGRWFH